MRHRHLMPFGAECVADDTRFSIWAPSAPNIALVLDGTEHPMEDAGEGWRRLTVPGVAAGTRYGYKVGSDLVPDPASRSQPDDVKGLSAVVDPESFTWTQTAWRGRPWEEAVISEVHVGTATPEGTFAALAETLPDLAAVGFTAIELMPIGEFHGSRNWGYDGVLPYAPDASYGTPDDLKRLVDRAHGLGLMVFLDVVYNHFGPVGNHLHAYAQPFFTERHVTPWGAGLNVDGDEGRPVRDFFAENALFWLEEYRMDGLRFDAVHAIQDDSDEHLIGELARRARAVAPNRHIHLVLENETNDARWLERDGSGDPILHTAQWADDVHHCWHVLLTGEREAYYEDFADDPVARLRRGLSEGFVYQGEGSPHAGGKPRGTPSGHLPPSAFVTFLQNHDQVGNRALGDRLAPHPARHALARAGLLLAPQIPMLFMGEEWAASAPFQFFVDFSDDPALSRAVRDGRRREFKHFAAFAGPDAETAVPDPTEAATFDRSKLDWGERTAPGHAGVLAETRALIAIRHEHVVPLTKSRFLGASPAEMGETAVDITWRFDAGALRFVAELGDDTAECRLDRDERVIWASPAVAHAAGSAKLPSWSGLFSLRPTR